MEGVLPNKVAGKRTLDYSSLPQGRAVGWVKPSSGARSPRSNPALPLTACVTLGKLCTPSSVLLCLHLQKGDNNSTDHVETHKLMYANCLEQSLARRRYDVFAIIITVIIINVANIS